MIRVVAMSVVLAVASGAAADTHVFMNDYAGFASAAGNIRTIDFETLPNGQPSHTGVLINDSTNYDAQGVHFSTPLGYLAISGNSATGFSLGSFTDPFRHTWTVAGLGAPSTSVGVFFPGFVTVSILDDAGATILANTFGGPGSGHFLGFISTTEIASVVVDNGGPGVDIESFVFHPVPEPSTLALLAVGAMAIRARRRRVG